MSGRAFRVGGGGGVGGVSPSGVGTYFRKRTHDPGIFGGLRSRGIFVFGEDKASFML
jgi:hypothetical protein